MITYIFTPANIRLSFENAKRFLEYFFDGPTRISQIDFFVASNGYSHLVSMEKLRKESKIREIREIRVQKSTSIIVFQSRPGPSSRRGFLTPSLLASSPPSLSRPQ